ncbi:6309_t:CDS:10 [Ambispora gerdemannii]|uniref:6309_t:CDS:1 n=1 Tax=Ambispora gerdemannii TaxID=144530 RepID=A0A9N8V0X4_9GLOM|nr:6309_t:CDS:10 [Ambispora gerdemannii]
MSLKAAKDGASIAIAAKTVVPHPKLPGTIYTAAEGIERAGGKGELRIRITCPLPLVCDIRDDEAIKAAIKNTVCAFGGIDIVVNNASAISLTDTQKTSLKTYNLMNEVNTRGTWLVTKHALSSLLESAQNKRNPHILNISPPLSMQEESFSKHVAYSIAKYGMSMCVLGWAGEFRGKIAVNDKNLGSKSRKSEIMADAAHVILTKPVEFTGNFSVDEIVLRKNGQTEFDNYLVTPGNEDPTRDLFLDKEVFEQAELLKKEQEKSK